MAPKPTLVLALAWAAASVPCLGQADRPLFPVPRHPAGDEPSAAASADLNSDGSSDLLLAPSVLDGSRMSAVDYGPLSHIDPDDLPVAAANQTLKVSETFRVLQANHYVDDDGDGALACEDCDDEDDTIFPGAEEICDEKDNDCDGEIDEGIL